MRKNVMFYGLVIGVFSLMLWLILSKGESDYQKSFKASQEGSYIPAIPEEVRNPWNVFTSELVHNLNHPLAKLILQIILIVIVARVFGYLFTRIKQPAVIGEIIAGIVLGPSLLGNFYPEFSKFLFPVESFQNLQMLSQIGLILFMFIIGMELDVKILKNKAHTAIVISHASIIFPYFLGVSLAYYLYQFYGPADISFTAFALFMGIAMSITAFPVLARIIQERGMTRTPLGSLVITCAAADDITAWCILAAVVAVVKAGGFLSALYTIGFAMVYVIFMLLVVQPFLKKLGNIYISKEILNKKIVALVLLILLTSSYLTEVIGIHALFGAFLAGVVMPQNLNFKRLLTDKVEDISLVLLLPLFFVLTGLRTEIGLLNNSTLWLNCFLIIFIAVLGKFGGSAIAAKVVGQSWRNSLVIGALMNTRGLMELVVLNIGYDLGILTPEIFAMLVIMALVTTFMTGPSMDIINKFFVQKSKTDSQLSSDAFNILLSFGPPKMGSVLLKLASQLIYKENIKPEITALHMTPNSETTSQELVYYEKEGFKPIKETAQHLGIKLNTKYKATEEISREIINETHTGNFDLLLIGSAKSMFSEDRIGGKVREIFDESTCDIGVLIDKGFNYARNILLIVENPSDKSLVEFGLKFINTGAKLTIVDKGISEKTETDFFSFIPQQYKLNRQVFEIIGEQGFTALFFQNFDLTMLSIDTWKSYEEKKDFLKNATSVLIYKPGPLKGNHIPEKLNLSNFQ